VLEDLGVQGMVLDVIKSLYAHYSAAVRTSEGLYETFRCFEGAKQGCPLRPLYSRSDSRGQGFLEIKFPINHVDSSVWGPVQDPIDLQARQRKRQVLHVPCVMNDVDMSLTSCCR